MDKARTKVTAILNALRGGERIWYRVSRESTIAWLVIDARWLSEYRAEVCITGDDSTWRPLTDDSQLFFESAQLSVAALREAVLDVIAHGDELCGHWSLYKEPNPAGREIEEARVNDDRLSFADAVVTLVRQRLITQLPTKGSRA